MYVDDLLIASPDLSWVAAFKKGLHQRFGIKDIGPVRFIIGVRVTRNRATRTLTLCQEAYIQGMIDRFGMHDCNTESTPLPTGWTPNPSGCTSAALDSTDRELYKSLIGSLLYASMISRPDISTAVSMLCRVMAAPKLIHLKAAKRVMRYLKGTIGMGITYSGCSQPSTDPLSATYRDLRGYSDADWASSGATEQFRSTSGYLFTLHGGPISWRSALQSGAPALSSQESEYIALNEAGKEALPLRGLLAELGFPSPGPVPLMEDNTAAISLTDEFFSSKRGKHISLKYHWIRWQTAANEFSICHVPTRDQRADILTKNLPPADFLRHRTALLTS